jgi:hypothetical protein
MLVHVNETRLQVVDEEARSLLGQPAGYINHGFTVPLKQLVPDDSPIRKLLTTDELRLLQRRLSDAGIVPPPA